MEVNDIKETLRLAKAELDNCRESHDGEYLAKLEQSVDAVETWLVSIGALPSR